MRILLDTHVLLWAVAEPDRIAEPYRGNLESAQNEVFFSAASIWEIAIKTQIGRLQLPVPPEDIALAATRMNFAELVVNSSHAAATRKLPAHHRDPFDRILIAQALHEPARLLTADGMLAKYSDLVDVLP